MQVKKKVKEKKGRLTHPRIDIPRKAIPSRFDFVVDGVDRVEPSVKLGAVSVGQAGIIGGGIGGEEVDQVHVRENETFFGAVNFFFRFFSDFFSERGTFRASWNIFVEHFFLRGTFFFLDMHQARGPGQARIGENSPPLPPPLYRALYKALYIIYGTTVQLLYCHLV